MGCFSTVPVKVRTNTNIIAQPQPTQSTIWDLTATVTAAESGGEMISSFEAIVKHISSFRSSSNMMPIACLSSDSTAIATFPIYEPKNESSEIKLPVLAIHNSPQGKIACYSHVSSIQTGCFESKDTAQLFLNIVSWITNNDKAHSTILLLEVAEKYSSEIRLALHSQSIHGKIGNFSTDLSKYEVVLVTDDLDTSINNRSEILRQFLSKGGGLVVFHVPDQPYFEPPINNFLRDFGLAYTPATMSHSVKHKITIDVHQKYDDARQCHMICFVSAFQMLTSGANPDPDLAELDDLVATLNYHVLVASSKHISILRTLYNSAFLFLQNSHFVSRGFICPNTAQSITTALVINITSKLPPSYLHTNPSYILFPGSSDGAETGTRTLQIKLREQCWISTGLWLQPGETGSIEFDKAIPGVVFQVGSHDQSLLHHEGPWKRWPYIIMSFPMKENKTDVGTPFGGLLYVTVNDEFDPSENDISYTFRFCDFCPAPRAVACHPEIYEQTKMHDIPWGEIFTRTSIFTLPSNKMLAMKSIDDFAEAIDYWISKLFKFLLFSPIRPYRIVFDVELVSPEPGYPIYFPEDDMDSILTCGDPDSSQSLKKGNESSETLDSLIALSLSKTSVSDATTSGNESQHSNEDSSVWGRNSMILREQRSSRVYVPTSGSQSEFKNQILSKRLFQKDENKAEIPGLDNLRPPKVVPSKALVKLLIDIGIVSLPAGYFDSNVEIALSAVAVTLIIKEIFPDFSLPSVGIEEPVLCHELLLLCERGGQNVIFSMLNDAQDSNAILLESEEDMWLRFVKDLCQRSKLNLSGILEKSKAIPLNLIKYLKEFPEPQF